MKIIFYKGGKTGSVIDKFIAWWTRGPYSHVEVMFDDDPRAKSVSCASAQRGQGVRFDILSLDPLDWDVMNVSWILKEESQAWFRVHEGLNYDYAGLLGLFTPVDNEYNHWFCSEACAASIGVPEPWRLDPNRFALLLRMMGGQWDTSFSTIAAKF